MHIFLMSFATFSKGFLSKYGYLDLRSSVFSDDVSSDGWGQYRADSRLHPANERRRYKVNV